MKVAFPKSGGLPIWEFPILTELRKIGIDSKFILPRIDNRIDHEFYDVARTIRGIPSINRMINNSSFSKIMNGILNVRTVDLTSKFWNIGNIAKDYDVIHLVDEVMSPNQQFVDLKKKCVMTVWENIPFNPMTVLKKPTSASWNKIKLRIDHFAPVSEDSVYMLRLNGIDEDRITKVHPGIDTDFFRRTTEKDLKKLINPDGKFLLLGVGRVVYEKGLTFTLRALKKLKESGRDVLYVHIGSGDKKFREYLMKLSDLLGVRDNVKMIGSVPYGEIRKYYSIADVFILASIPNLYWEEQLGYATLESMACGTVPIVSDNTTTREVVPDGCGFRIPAGNVQSFCESVEQVMDSPEESRRMRDNGIKHVNDEYSAKNTARLYKEIYERIVHD